LTRFREQRLEARFFAVGSTLFAVGAAICLIFTGLDARVSGVLFFIGSIFFTIASAVQWLLSGRLTRGAWHSAGWSDWWSAAIQFPGTVCFNVSTFAALHDWSAAAERSHVWKPDVYGSAAFLVSSLLAVHACTIRDRLWDPSSRIWKVTWFNLFGSVAFGVSAVAARISLDSGNVANAELDAAATLAGALGFLFGALLSSPDPNRS